MGHIGKIEQASIQPLISSFKDLKGQVELLTLQGFMALAIINAAWHMYHSRLTQSTWNAAIVAVLLITEGDVEKGMVADNLSSSKELERDLRQTAFGYKKNLEKMGTEIQNLEKHNRSLRETSSTLDKSATNLSSQVDFLEKVTSIFNSDDIMRSNQNSVASFNRRSTKQTQNRIIPIKRLQIKSKLPN